MLASWLNIEFDKMRTALTQFSEKIGNREPKCPQDRNLRASKLAIKVSRSTNHQFYGDAQFRVWKFLQRQSRWDLPWWLACWEASVREGEELAWILQKLEAGRLGVFKTKVAKRRQRKRQRRKEGDIIAHANAKCHVVTLLFNLLTITLFKAFSVTGLMVPLAQL